MGNTLVVSRGVASTLEMGEAFQPVLDAALVGGASAARVVFSPQLLPETPLESPSWFSAGKSRDIYAHLDEQILNQIGRAHV